MLKNKYLQKIMLNTLSSAGLKHLQKIMLNTLSSAGLTGKHLQKITLFTLFSAGFVSKHLQRLAIILSCAGIMSNTLACGPDASESREYTVKLLNPAGNIDNSAKISFTQQQFREIESGKCPEGFVKLLNAKFNDIHKGLEFYDFTPVNYPRGLEMEGEEIIVSAVKQKLWFHVEEDKIYICHPRFRHEVYIRNIRLDPGDYYNLPDLNDALRYFQDLNIDDTSLRFAVTSIINHDDLMKFYDAICFLQELSERRNEGIEDTVSFLFNLDYDPQAYSLTKYSVNEYTLTATVLIAPALTAVAEYGRREYGRRDWRREYGRRESHARYEFFLENKSEKNDRYEGNYNSCSDLKFFDQSKMILKKVKFLDWEYSFKNELYVINSSYFAYVEKALNQEKNNKLRFRDYSLSYFKTNWDSFNLEDVFAPIERELNFIESLAEVRGEDMWDMMGFLRNRYLGLSPDKFLFTQGPETKNYSMRCMRDQFLLTQGPETPAFLYELGIESKSYSLSAGLFSFKEFDKMVGDMRTEGANMFLRSIKLIDKDYKFEHDIDFVKKGRYILRDISERLSLHINEKLNHILFHETKERWNSINLAEAMKPIEEIYG